ncbi:MAG: CHAT domain-containing protein, partial [Acidobacteriaceae bacterium]|nr:CHAT domain-containing protein [Acidobacteriaceae bacterium]
MRWIVRLFKVLVVAVGIILTAIVVVKTYGWVHWFLLPPAERLLVEADDLADKANWKAAARLYRQAERLFHQGGNAAFELYAKASQIPAQTESSLQPMSEWLAQVDQLLSLPAARDPKAQLRLLEIKGQVENNYDATLAFQTWITVEQMAAQQHNLTVENRAYGEEAIGLFLLGDTAGARRHAFRGYTKTWLLGDREGRMRLAALIGAGMVQFGAYQDALKYLDEAISIARSIPDAAYPSVAVTAKIDALRGLQRYSEALVLSREAMRVPERDQLKGHLYQILNTRAPIWKDLGDLPQATQDYAQAFRYAKELGYWRGLTESGGPLAQMYQEQNQLPLALATINETLDAQKQIPSEMYFAPRNLAIKAEILKELGRVADSNNLYERSLALVDSLLLTAPTPNVANTILEEYSRVYSGYFASLCAQGNWPGAFAVIERAHGRQEVESLQSRKHLAPHPPTPQERALTALNLKLINTEDQSRRRELLSQMTGIEDQLDLDPWSYQVAIRPVAIESLQKELRSQEVLIEYVLDNPVSYALVITSQSVKPYSLASKKEMEAETVRYVSRLAKQQMDLPLAGSLYGKLLAPVEEIRTHSSLIFVMDGKLNLLPPAALHDGTQYLIASHTTSVVSAATVLHTLRVRRGAAQVQPFMGFAPWAQEQKSRKAGLPFSLLPSWRGADGPQRSEFVPLPESKHEIITGRDEVDKLDGVIPSRDQIRLASEATESQFKKLPLASYRVLHLAMHGYVDLEHPDRSALVFAHDPKDPNDDGLLQLREIRQLHLTSSLVILSACKTGLGPAGEGGITNLSNAFLQAGAHTVVSSFWAVSDHATSQMMD